MEFGINCSPAQMRKLKSGGAVTLNSGHFADNAPHRLVLTPSSSRRVQTALRKNKGVRIALKPEEDIVAMTEGGKISLKSIGKTLGKTARDVGKVYADTGRVIKRGWDREMVDSGLGRNIASNLIDVGSNILLPAALGGVSMLAGDPTGISGNVVGSIAGKYIDEAAARKGYGMKPRQGKGFFKTLKKVTGINKKDVVKVAKDVGKQAARVGAQVAGEALTAYTGNPMAGQAFERIAVGAADRAIDSKSGKDVLKNAGKGAMKQGKLIAVEGIDDYIDKNLTGAERDVAQKALAGKYPSASDLIYDYGNSKLEEMDLGQQQMMGYGLPRRTRGGLRMGRGSPYMTGSYEGAMRHIRSVNGGAISSGMRVADDRMVSSSSAPSDIIQTGSPFQRYASPAMSPFIAGSPQLVGQGIMGSGKCGGSFLPAGYRGGSFIPAGV